MYQSNNINRRKMIKKSAAAAAISFLPFQYSCSHSPNKAKNGIVEENEKPGTQDWILKREEISFDESTAKYLWMGPVRSSMIEGYCDRLYVKQGGEISFHISSKMPSNYNIDIYRIGYYQGNGGRLIESIGPLKGRDMGTPDTDPDTYLIECNWEKAHTQKIPKDWVSGFYVAKIKTVDGWANYMSFVVTDEDQHDFVFHVTDFTSHSYNRWPEHHSLYNNVETGIDNYWGPINVSSFRRPQGKLSQLVDLPLTLGAGEFFAWQYPFVFWAEKMGFDITYISNMTLHEGGVETLARAKGFLSVGHDEYWTDKMYENAIQARNLGVSMGFFCGNSVFGRFQLPADDKGLSNQRLQRDGRLNDKDLMGSGTGEGIISGGDWQVHEAGHWIFEGSGMKNGDAIESIVGWECHNNISKNIPNIKKIAYGPTNYYKKAMENIKNGEHGEFVSTYYDVEGTNGFVFNAATCWWVYAFDSPPGWKRSNWYDCRQTSDPRAMKITQTVMEGMIKRGEKNSFKEQ